jgi:hypothetical protein
MGLDYDFLHYIGSDSAAMRRIRGFYLPHFSGCHSVVDLGCGDGDFVALLREAGHDAVGVDADPKVCTALRSQGIPVVEQDVFAYLSTASDGSADGIFSAHLVEHLPYLKVLELATQAYRVLRPGGVIVLATPDVRSLYTHLESFYLHFGHVSFYHPRLLCFFLEQAGFTGAEYGANPATASPMLTPLQGLAQRPPRATTGRAIAYRREIPPQGNSLVQRLSYRVKRRLASWLVQPFTDSLAAATNDQLAGLDRDLLDLAQALQSLNGPYECYATAYKPHRDGLPPARETP